MHKEKVRQRLQKLSKDSAAFFKMRALNYDENFNIVSYKDSNLTDEPIKNITGISNQKNSIEISLVEQLSMETFCFND